MTSVVTSVVTVVTSVVALSVVVSTADVVITKTKIHNMESSFSLNFNFPKIYKRNTSINLMWIFTSVIRLSILSGFYKRNTSIDLMWVLERVEVFEA